MTKHMQKTLQSDALKVLCQTYSILLFLPDGFSTDEDNRASCPQTEGSSSLPRVRLRSNFEF